MSGRQRRRSWPTFQVSPAAAHQVAQALQLHRRWAAERGYGVLPEVSDLYDRMVTAARRPDLVTRTASGRQEPPFRDSSGQARERGGVALLAVTYDEAAAALSISRRSVERLVAGGELSAVRLGRSSRVRVTDLNRYLDALSQEENRGAQ